MKLCRNISAGWSRVLQGIFDTGTRRATFVPFGDDIGTKYLPPPTVYRPRRAAVPSTPMANFALLPDDANYLAMIVAVACPTSTTCFPSANCTIMFVEPAGKSRVAT